MSKKESSPKKGDQAPDLSALDFGPAWAKKDQNQKPRRAPQGKDTKDTGGPEKRQRSPSYSKDGADRQGGGQKRRSDQGQRGQRGRSSDGDQRDFKKGSRDRHAKPRSPMAPPTEGVTARIMPIEEGMDAMAKQISATGRTHSVFELAWVVLGGMDRFHIIFESEEQPIYRSKSDHSVWLSQKECMAHFWSAGLHEKYYTEDIIEVDAPAGNFQSVARCGFSGKLIGPPNHHAYQQTLLNIHREQFSNMAIDRYKSKIVMEHSEEAVQEWVDGMRKQARWRPKSEASTDVETAEETEDSVDVPTPAIPSVEEQADIPADQSTEGEAIETEVESEAVPAPSESVLVVEPSEAPVIEETIVILSNHREVEQHFMAHEFEQEFESAKQASALANIPSRMISPGLMSVLKNVVAEEKRYPGKLASILCRQMSGRHLAVFKWKKRLHSGPARPKHIPDDMVIADRPSALFKWVQGKPGGNIDEMWKDSLPSDVDDDTRHLWYHDLHWLINEGLVLLFSDGTLHAAKELEKEPKKQPSKKAKKKTAKKKMAKKETPIEGKPAADQPTGEIQETASIAPSTEVPPTEASVEAPPPDSPAMEK